MPENKNPQNNTDQDLLYKKRHSLSHILAYAVIRIFGRDNVKLGIGPVIENGFYYDFLLDQPISENDLAKIEEEMRSLLSRNYPFEKSEMTIGEATEYLLKMDQKFKLELVNELANGGAEKVSFYTVGEFTDLCKGPHVDDTSVINPHSFKLTSIAGAYWRGDEKKPMLQRIYGVAFNTKEELDDYINKLEEAKKRDHRKLGKQLDLFTFSDLVGPGLPLFTPRGTYLRNQLARYSEQLQLEGGFEMVWIPHITKVDLYKTSGHWDKFGHELMIVQSRETETEMALKPMNCPHHAQIYASRIRSYKELPIRYCETTTVYRDEKAGELHGLSRVRSLTQDDGHVFCRVDQIEYEINNIMQMIKKLYQTLGMSFRARLSFHDPENPDKYLGNKETWRNAEMMIENVAKNLGLDYFIALGEAAFYGPKIDIMVTDSLGREWQCATQQLDFVQPSRFGLTYVDAHGKEKTPVMIHKALLGSIERFLSVYIEHVGGNFPLWLSYIQGIVIPVSNEKHSEYALEVSNYLKSKGLRVKADVDNESMNNKIRKAQEQKIPYMFIVGDKEEESKAVSVRTRAGLNIGLMTLDEIASRMLHEYENRL